MKFVNIKQYAELKGCSRPNIYNAEENGEISVERSAGFPVIYLNDKNRKWEPRKKGRPIQKVNSDK